MKRYWIAGALSLLLLVGCNTQLAITGKAYEEFLKREIPFGGRWVKEGMTRNSRLADWEACGGDSKLGDGFRNWIKPEKWEVYWPAYQQYTQKISYCMHDKGYAFHNPQRPGREDQCDDGSCLYP